MSGKASGNRMKSSETTIHRGGYCAVARVIDHVPLFPCVFPCAGNAQVPAAEVPWRAPLKLIPPVADPDTPPVPLPEKGMGPSPGQLAVPANPAPLRAMRNSQGSVLPALGPAVTTTGPFQRPVQTSGAAAPEDAGRQRTASRSKHDNTASRPRAFMVFPFNGGLLPGFGCETAVTSAAEQKACPIVRKNNFELLRGDSLETIERGEASVGFYRHSKCTENPTLIEHRVFIQKLKWEKTSSVG